MKTSLKASLIALALVSGCVTVQDIEGQLATWHGIEADLLVSDWGAPYGSYTRKDGSQILSFASARVVTIGADGFERAQSRACQVDVTIDKTNLVLQAKWRGELDQCAAMIRPYIGQKGEAASPGSDAPMLPSE